MKKLIIFALCIAMGGALFAQSKSELKEQLDALTAQVETLKSDLNNSIQERNQLQRTMTAERNQLQSTITLLEEKIAALNNTINMQNTSLASYADQVARLNNEISNLTNLVISDTARRAPMPAVNAPAATSPRERIVVFSNTKNNTFTVPEGKIWIIEGSALPWVIDKYNSGLVFITRWNSKKITGNIYEWNKYHCVIPEKTTIKVQIRTGDDSYANDAEGCLIIQEYDM